MLTSLSPMGGYVRSEYIGTVGCFSSPTLCGKWLNRHKGFRPVLLTHKPFHNIGEETFTPEALAKGRLAGNRHGGESPHFFNLHRRRFLPHMKEWVSAFKLDETEKKPITPNRRC